MLCKVWIVKKVVTVLIRLKIILPKCLMHRDLGETNLSSKCKCDTSIYPIYTIVLKCISDLEWKSYKHWASFMYSVFLSNAFSTHVIVTYFANISVPIIPTIELRLMKLANTSKLRSLKTKCSGRINNECLHEINPAIVVVSIVPPYIKISENFCPVTVNDSILNTHHQT